MRLLFLVLLIASLRAHGKNINKYEINFQNPDSIKIKFKISAKQKNTFYIIDQFGDQKFLVLTSDSTNIFYYSTHSEIPLILYYANSYNIVPYVLLPGCEVEFEMDSTQLPYISKASEGNNVQFLNFFFSLTTKNKNICEYNWRNLWATIKKDKNIKINLSLDSCYKENLNSINLIEPTSDKNSFYFKFIISKFIHYEYLSQKMFNIDKPIANYQLETSYPELQEDSLVIYPFYKNFLSSYGAQLNKKNFYNPNASKELFDVIAKDITLSRNAKDYLLFSAIRYMAVSKNKNYNTYIVLFKEKCTDPGFLSYIDENFVKTSIGKNGMNVLRNISNNRIDFDALIRSYKGKFIYIDFWASWCVPCRAAMNSSRELQLLYKSKDIVFIYISIDEQSGKWKEAAKDERLISFPNSFILENPMMSGLAKRLKLDAIPRYLLYNKKGELINDNAPGPDTNTLKILIDKNLGN